MDENEEIECTIRFKARRRSDGKVISSGSSMELLGSKSKAVAYKDLVTRKLLEIGVDLNTAAAQAAAAAAGGAKKE